MQLVLHARHKTVVVVVVVAAAAEVIINLYFMLCCCYLAFSASTLLVGWQEGHPVCNKTVWWGAGMVVSLERGPTDATATHCLLLQ